MIYQLRAGLLGILLILTGCGQELLAGGQKGEVDAVVVDDGALAGSALSMNRISEPRAFNALGPNAVAVQGRVEVDATVSIVDAGGLVRVLAQENPRVAVPIASADSFRLALDLVPVGAYDRALVTFTRVEANITGGLQLVGGLQITGRVWVPLNPAVTVEAAVPLLVRLRQPQRLVIDINAADWLVEASALDGVVPAATFASKVRVRVR